MLDANSTKVTCSHSSLLTFMGATVIRHGRDPDGSGQVGHATRRGTGVPPVTVMAKLAMLPPCALFKVVPLRFCEPSGDIIGFGPSGDGFWDSPWSSRLECY